MLRGVSLGIRQGEFVGVLGPNGAGKTTLFRTILGLQPMSAGSLSVFGAAPCRGNPGHWLHATNPHWARPGKTFVVWIFWLMLPNGHHFGLPLSSKAIRDDVAAALKSG